MKNEKLKIEEKQGIELLSVLLIFAFFILTF